jgi:lipopolysaccharide biosynthesis regulator YciM
MEIWFAALVILAFVLGWVFAHLSNRPNTSKPDQLLKGCSESYIQGLNYLLANNSDKAIEVFVELVKVDAETMETHLALGNLFRSKGEVDRAIKIHQNLIARPNLNQSQRTMALSELAEDYQKAGLLDRAENLYRELVQINPNNAQAQRKLLEMYTMEKSWGEARDAAKALVALNEPDSRLILAHCYCEMAQQALGQGNLRRADDLLKQALQADKESLRASLLSIDLHLRNSEVSKARRIFEQLVQSGVHAVEWLIPPAREILLQRGSAAQYQQFLKNCFQKKPSSAVATELLESYLQDENHEALLAFLKTALKQSTSLDIFEFAMRYFKSHPQFLDDSWPDLTSQFREIKRRRVSYSCGLCGYGSHSMFWNCPSCKSWSSLKPVT